MLDSSQNPQADDGDSNPRRAHTHVAEPKSSKIDRET